MVSSRKTISKASLNVSTHCFVQITTASCSEYRSYLVVVVHHDVGFQLSTLAPGQSPANVGQEAALASLDVVEDSRTFSTFSTFRFLFIISKGKRLSFLCSPTSASTFFDYRPWKKTNAANKNKYFLLFRKNPA